MTNAMTRHPLGVAPQYVFVLLAASMVALSITTLVLLNSCRYMRLI